MSSFESFHTTEEDAKEYNMSSLDSSGRSRFDVDNNGRLTSEEQQLNKNFISKTEYLLLLNPLVPGYSLKLNKWRE